MKKYIATGLILMIAACHNNSTVTNEKDSTTDTFAGAKTDTLVTLRGTHDVINYDSVITLHFGEDSVTASATGYEDDAGGKHITFLVEVTRGKKLEAEVQPLDSAGNIRITQIVMPSGKMDGPFGRTMDYDISEKGVYKILTGPNMMAGDVWKGAFKIKVTVK